jgi:hypothetical protein
VGAGVHMLPGPGRAAGLGLWMRGPAAGQSTGSSPRARVRPQVLWDSVVAEAYGNERGLLGGLKVGHQGGGLWWLAADAAHLQGAQCPAATQGGWPSGAVLCAACWVSGT